MKNFKALTILGLLLIFISCNKESSSCTDIEDGVAFEFKEGDVFCINDYDITITQVMDERCPCDVVCIWEGEFLFILDILHEDDETIQYTHHAESLITQPNPSPTGLTFSKVILKSNDSCEDPMAISDMVFEMTIN